MYFHPWPLLFGMIFVGLAVLAWMGSFVIDDPLAGGLQQFLGRFVFPLFGAIACWGAFALLTDALPNEPWLHIAFIMLLALEAVLFVRVVRWRWRQLPDS